MCARAEGVHLPGSRQPRALRRQRCQIAALALLCAFAAGPAGAALIVDQEGQESIGGADLSITLTQGFLNGSDWFWTHTYAPIALPILSATLTIDLVDADDGFLDLYAGVDEISGVFFGTATGADQGSPPGPGTWRDLQDPPPVGAYDNVIVIPASLYADLADGEFQITGDNRPGFDLTVWGSNRAILTIVTAVPEPSSGLLLGAGLLLLALRRRARAS